MFRLHRKKNMYYTNLDTPDVAFITYDMMFSRRRLISLIVKLPLRLKDWTGRSKLARIATLILMLIMTLLLLMFFISSSSPPKEYVTLSDTFDTPVLVEKVYIRKWSLRESQYIIDNLDELNEMLFKNEYEYQEIGEKVNRPVEVMNHDTFVWRPEMQEFANDKSVRHHFVPRHSIERQFEIRDDDLIAPPVDEEFNVHQEKRKNQRQNADDVLLPPQGENNIVLRNEIQAHPASNDYDNYDEEKNQIPDTFQKSLEYQNLANMQETKQDQGTNSLRRSQDDHNLKYEPADREGTDTLQKSHDDHQNLRHNQVNRRGTDTLQKTHKDQNLRYNQVNRQRPDTLQKGLENQNLKYNQVNRQETETLKRSQDVQNLRFKRDDGQEKRKRLFHIPQFSQTTKSQHPVFVRHNNFLSKTIYSFPIERARKHDSKIPEEFFNIKTPVNPHNYSYIINPTDTCKKENGSNVFLIVPIISSVDNFNLRQTIRKTWAQFSMVYSHQVRFVFMLGASKLPYLQDFVKQESDLYGDIVQESFIDTYFNSTLKAIFTLRWVQTFCPYAKFMLRLNDDVMLHVYKFIRYLKNRGLPETKLYWGQVFKDSRVNKGLEKHEYQSKISWQYGTYYPPYCNGPYILMTMDVVKNMYKMSWHTPLMFPEDVYYGILAEKLGIRTFDASMHLVDQNEIQRPMEKFRLDRDNTRPEMIGHLGSNDKTKLSIRHLWRLVEKRTTDKNGCIKRVFNSTKEIESEKGNKILS